MRRIGAAACALLLSSLSVLLGSAFIAITTSAPTSAQSGDPQTALRRFSELYAAGNYAAALAEGQRFEAGVKARFGTNHRDYAVALYNLAIVH